MRKSGLGLVILLAACSAAKAPRVAAEGDEKIACAVAGARAFTPVCSVERSSRDGILTLVVHHPDGAFRRFDVLDHGRGLAVADGATQAVTRYADGMAEIAVDTDRYRFPITLKKPEHAR